MPKLGKAPQPNTVDNDWEKKLETYLLKGITTDFDKPVCEF